MRTRLCRGPLQQLVRGGSPRGGAGAGDPVGQDVVTAGGQTPNDPDPHFGTIKKEEGDQME